MKKIFLMIFVLALLLSACAMLPTATTVPTKEPTVAPTITPTSEEVLIFSWPGNGEVATPLPTAKPGEGINMRQLYEKYFTRVGSSIPEYWVGMAEMEIVGDYVEGSGGLDVLINGTPETIIDDVSCEGCSQIFFHDGSRTLGSKEITFNEENLFDRDWNSMYYYSFNNGEQQTLFIFPAGYLYTGLAIIPEPEMPEVVDVSKWNGTKTTLMEWEYPSGLIVNVDTRESSGPGMSVLAIDDNHHQIYSYGNFRMWGFVHVEKDRYGEWQNIIITQSEPDSNVYQRSKEYFEEHFPNETYVGPYDTCKMATDTAEDMFDEVFVQEMIDVCGVFYTDGNLGGF